MSYERLSVLLCHEEDCILLKVDSTIAGNHLPIVFQSPDLNLWVLGWDQILQSILGYHV